MKLPLKFARRYLFSKKSTNAINIISGISLFGIALGTTALILVLSVFNGFEDLLTGLFGHFNPDIKVEIIEGKTFEEDSTMIAQIAALPQVVAVSRTVEEYALFKYKKNNVIGKLKGVDENFKIVTRIDSTVREGTYRFKDGKSNMAVMGVGMHNQLNIHIGDHFSGMEVYMPKRKNPGPFGNKFRKKTIYPAGTFVIQQDFDSEYVLCDLAFAKSLLGQKNRIGALEIKIQEQADAKVLRREIQKITGPAFKVRDRYQQDEAFLKLMNIEKWMSYAILILTMILITFNMIGALWMLVLDKKQDISILRSMGATPSLLRNIFLSEGLLIGILGMLMGFILAIGLYIAQKTFGIVPIPSGFIVDAYPISMRLPDFVVTGVSVLFITFLASLPAAFKATTFPAIILSE